MGGSAHLHFQCGFKTRPIWKQLWQTAIATATDTFRSRLTNVTMYRHFGKTLVIDFWWRQFGTWVAIMSLRFLQVCQLPLTQSRERASASAGCSLSGRVLKRGKTLENCFKGKQSVCVCTLLSMNTFAKKKKKRLIQKVIFFFLFEAINYCDDDKLPKTESPLASFKVSLL